MIFHADESALRAKSSLIILAIDKHHKTLTEITKLLKNIKLTMNIKTKLLMDCPGSKQMPNLQIYALICSKNPNL